MRGHTLLSYALVAITTTSAVPFVTHENEVAARAPFNAGKIGVIVAAVEARQA